MCSLQSACSRYSLSSIIFICSTISDNLWCAANPRAAVTLLCQPPVGLCRNKKKHHPRTSVTETESSWYQLVYLWFQKRLSVPSRLCECVYVRAFRCSSGFIWLRDSSPWALCGDRESASEDFHSSHRPRSSFAGKSSSIHKSSWLTARRLAQDQIYKQQRAPRGAPFEHGENFLCTHAAALIRTCVLPSDTAFCSPFLISRSACCVWSCKRLNDAPNFSQLFKESSVEMGSCL